MKGEARRLLYWVAIETGYRSNELRQIRTSDVKELDGRAFICLGSEKTKNEKPAKQFISVQLEGELNAHLKGRRKASPVFGMPAAANVAKMLRGDLAATRELWIEDANGDAVLRKSRKNSDFLKYENAEQLKLDFHALRHTCGAWLVIAGINPKIVQTVMRHCSPTLTFSTYGHLMEGAEAGAVETVNVMASSQAKGPVQQICSKLSATDEISDATQCEDEDQNEDPETKKDLGKTKVFASSCETVPVSALAPPVGLEPTTNGLTVLGNDSVTGRSFFDYLFFANDSKCVVIRYASSGAGLG